MLPMAIFRSFSLIVSMLLLRCEAGEYDPTGRVYPWPLPTDRQPIFFSLIVSFGETFNSSGVVPGVNVALDIINSNNSNLLDGYSLHYILSDSQCLRTTALDVFFNEILSETEFTKLAVIGAGCSPATEPTAEISHQFNITQLSCVSTSPALSNRRRFRKYFQLLPSMVDLAHGYVGVFRHYGWRRVTLIVQEENLFTEMIRHLKELLAKEEVVYIEYIFSSNIGLSDLKVEPFTVAQERIYVIATYENYARALLCNAFHLNVRYPTHLLLTFQWYDKKWWLKEHGLSDIPLTCNKEQRESVLPYSLAFNFVLIELLKEQDVTTDIIGISGAEYIEKENAQLGTAPHYFDWSPYAQYCFDATLSLAYALTQTLTDVGDSKINSAMASAYGLSNVTFGLEHFNYKSDALTNVTFDHLSNTSLNGITGEVTFNENGVRTTMRLSIHQFKDVGTSGLDWVKIGTFIVGKDANDFVFDNETRDTLNNEETIWPSGVPYDGKPTENIVTQSIALVVIIYIFAAAGIIFAAVCLTFNFVFRNKKLVRLSSPKLNNITVFGVIILYISAVLFAIPTSSESVIMGLCIVRLWFLSLGVSLAFGTIIMKMFRVYLIFSKPTPKRKKFIQDWMLAVGVLVLVIIDLLVLIVFTAVVLGLNLKIVQRTPHRENPVTVMGMVRNVTEHYIFVCNSTPEKVVFGILSIYKGLLQLLAFFLAICIPRVKVKGLNDAKYIVAAVYVSSLGLILATLTHFTVSEYINTYTALYSVATCLSCTTILGLLFIPKMIGLYKDPLGENVFSDFHQHTSDILSAGVSGSVQLKRTAVFGTEDTLKKRIKELEHALSTCQSDESVLSTDDTIKSAGVVTTCTARGGIKSSMPVKGKATVVTV